ncbi:MAG: PIN domain-containing protein [Patulibacter sp.]|nr:PIN domain-containing protein [Patulibacter sp.]
MSVTVDANVLLYASDAGSPRQARALDVLREHVEGGGLLYLFWPVSLAYLRIATHPSIFGQPLSPAEASGNLEALIQRPNVRTPGEDERFWPALEDAIRTTTARGNLVPDAHVAALMRTHGVRTIITHDRDFRKFPGVEVLDPFTA